MTNWAEKYRPNTLDDIVGNRTAVSDLKKWAQSWSRRNPDKRAVILQGDAGVGKTSAALALANDMGWTVIEMNASDSRNAEAIRKTATRGAVLQTFSPTGEFLRASEGGRKLIVLDEADNVFGREDQGGIAAIVQMIQATQQPVVLIVNDYYALTSRSSALRKLCKTIKFQSIHAPDVKKVLRTIALKEGLDVAEDVLDVIAERSKGDLRSAVNDLESIALGGRELRGEATKALGYRDRESTIFTALQEIFRSGDARRARDALRELDEAPEDVILWIDHNLPFEYGGPEDLSRGYDWLSRADVYLGRTRRGQSYGLWSYASEMMSSGVAAARRGRPGTGQLQFPAYLLRMSRSRAVRSARNSLANKLGRYLHASVGLILSEVLHDFKALFASDEEFRLQATIQLALDEKEAAYLLDEKEDSHTVKHLMERAEKVRGMERREEPRGALSGFDEDANDPS